MTAQAHHAQPQPHPYHDPELKKYMKMLANANRSRAIIYRALLTGVFTAVGTTIGFALLIIFAASFIGSLKNIPIIENMLRETKLDVLIEDQLSRIQKGETGDTDTVEEETYADSTYKLTFKYPSTFSSVQQVDSDSTGKVIQLEGSGPLRAFYIYINRQAAVSGDASEIEVTAEALQLPIKVSVYEKGAKVNSVEYQNAVYVAKLGNAGNEYIFVGLADNSRPKLAREVYLGIMQSLDFKQN